MLKTFPTLRAHLNLWLLIALLASFGPASAQFRVEVSGVGLSQMPIAIATFRGEATAPQKVGAIVKSDLERSGVFRAVDAAGAVIDEATRPDLTSWRQKGADSLVTGSIAPLADGRFDVRFKLWDTVRGQELGSQNYAVSAADLRLSAHRIADFVYEKLTGEKGIFSTRIAYVTKAGVRYTLWVRMPMVKTHSLPWAAPSQLFRPLGRQTARNWLTFLLSHANQLSTHMTWPRASAG